LISFITAHWNINKFISVEYSTGLPRREKLSTNRRKLSYTSVTCTVWLEPSIFGQSTSKNWTLWRSSSRS